MNSYQETKCSEKNHRKFLSKPFQLLVEKRLINDNESSVFMRNALSFGFNDQNISYYVTLMPRLFCSGRRVMGGANSSLPVSCLDSRDTKQISVALRTSHLPLTELHACVRTYVRVCVHVSVCEVHHVAGGCQHLHCLGASSSCGHHKAFGLVLHFLPPNVPMNVCVFLLVEILSRGEHRLHPRLEGTSSIIPNLHSQITSVSKRTVLPM